MRYWFFALLGLAVCGASIVAMDWGIYHLFRTGSCASGGPYVSARPCPPGTGGHVLALVGGIFGGFGGVGLFAARGGGTKAPTRFGLGLLMWTLLFVGLSGAMLLAAFGPAANDDSGAKWTAALLALFFIPMGLGPLLLGRLGAGKAAKALELVQHGKRAPGVVQSVEDTGMTINDNPRVRIVVRAEPPGEPAFTIEKTTVVSRVEIPRAGDRCVVFYDPADPQGKNGITFDAVPGFDVPAPATPATPDDGDDDPLAKIEKLGVLRDKGLITPEEFETQKQRLLRDV